MYIRILAYGIQNSNYGATVKAVRDNHVDHPASESLWNLAKYEADAIYNKTGLEINKAPAIAFMEVQNFNAGTGKVIGMIRGIQSYDNIEKYYLQALNGELGSGIGPGEIVPQITEGDGNSILPGWGNGLPRWIWLAIAGAGTYKTVKAKSDVAKVGYGIASTIAWKKYFK